MFQTNQQIGGYTLVAPIKRGDFSEVWVVRIRETPAHSQKDIFWLIEVSSVNGQIEIISEYPNADSLKEKLKTHLFSTEQAIKLTIAILDGLDHLHKKGIIYRRLNPHNIFFQNETPILADFGFSNAPDDPEFIPPVDIYSYLAPEAFADAEICNVQTDIWSVGVILYQLLSGKLPFPQEGINVMLAILMSEFSPLPDETPVRLKEIVSRALAKKPENRYQSTEAMREDLRSALNFIKYTSAKLTLKFLLPTYPELVYPEALVIHGIRTHNATGGSVSEIAVAFDSSEKVTAFYEEKFGKGQINPDYGRVQWRWEDNIGSLEGYKMISVYPETSIDLLTEQWKLEIPANTKTLISVGSSHW